MAALPISIIVATRNRANLCATLLNLIKQQEQQPAEIIFCDASDDEQTKNVIGQSAQYLRAEKPGAASQRNQAIQTATQPFVLLMDDDITPESGCLGAMWGVMQSHTQAGGVTATIVNEAYTPPGKWTRSLLKWFENGHERKTYAGACVGPGYTFWPADDVTLPDAVPVEWMGAGCALYRRDLLPDPPFAKIFHGASLCEDLALSLTVAKKAPLLQATRARFTHLNVGGDHKNHVRRMAAMRVVNRHYVMTRVLGKNTALDYIQLAAMLLFGIIGKARQGSWSDLIKESIGYVQGCFHIRNSHGHTD